METINRRERYVFITAIVSTLAETSSLCFPAVALFTVHSFSTKLSKKRETSLQKATEANWCHGSYELKMLR
jgi:hypothetical protein